MDLGGPWRLGLAAGSGLLLALSLPAWDLGWLAFVGLVPLLVACRGRTPLRAAWLGFVSGLAFYLTTIWWVVTTMTTYGGMPLPLAGLALLLLAAVLAGYTAAFAALVAWGERRAPVPTALRPALAAALWTGLEFLRAHLFSGFPWMLLGYSQHGQPVLRLLAAATGVYGLSALLVLVNGTLAEAAVGWGAADRAARRGWAAAAVVAALAVGGAVAFGFWGWVDGTGGPPVRVGLLQGNIEQARKWDRAYQVRTLETYERLARRAVADGAVLLVWPETAVPFLLRREPELGGRVLRLAAETGVPMLVGSPDLAEDGRLYNTAFVVTADGRLAGRYDKRHLVPFGEYVPLKRLFFFVEKLAVGIGDFGRGPGATLLEAGGLRLGVMICYEAIFPGEVREFAAGGAQLLVNITNDAWFGRSGAPAQHLAMAAMRAVENGTYLVRAANTGVTALVAPTGEILARTELFTEAALTGAVRLRQRSTPYTRYGDVAGWAGLAILAGYAGLLLVRQWRMRSAKEWTHDS
jgi:apolipoprotein N-acyltransferase